MAYANEQDIKQAEALGYTYDTNQQRGTVFNKGNRKIWGICQGWQTADLINGAYKNHRKYTDLSEALKRPL